MSREHPTATDGYPAQVAAASAPSDFPAGPPGFPAPAESPAESPGGPPGGPFPGLPLPGPTPGAAPGTAHGTPPGTAVPHAAGTVTGSGPVRTKRAARSRQRRPAGATADGRDPFFDNAKFLLVVLVVLGHNWNAVADGMRGVKAAYLFVYAFHMPLFVLLCGYFSRNFTGRPDQVRKLLAGVLLPYLVFEAAYAGVYTLFLDQPFAVTPTEPRYLCWFLAALFIWRLTAPVWNAVRWPVAVAVLISVAAGLTDLGSELALSRLLMFLPWFVLGLRLRPEHFRPLRNPASRRWALPVLVGGAVGAYWVAPRVSRDWLLMDVGSEQLGVPPLLYAGVRLALFGIGVMLAAAFMALVPSRRTGFSALGAFTVYPFLLHGLVVKTVEGLGGYEAVFAGGLIAVAVTTLGAAAFAVLLGAEPVRRVLWPLIEPRFPGWLSPDRAAPRADSARNAG